MSQGQLARALGRPQAVLSRWESGRLEPRLPDLVAVARALAIDLESLVDGAMTGPGRHRSGRGSPLEARRRVGDLLREARERSTLDTITVARRVGCSVRRLRRIEGGQEPSLAELGRLVQALQIPVMRVATASLDTPEDPPRVLEDTEMLV
jgi:transcriptional regulator with XRE-family HTH domain